MQQEGEMTRRTLRTTGKVAAAAVVALLLPVMLASSRVNPDSIVDLVVESGSVKVSGTSNVHDWTCEAKRFGAELQVRTQGAGGPPAGVTRADVTIPVDALDCGDTKMNGNLRKALKADAHPTISFAMTGHEMAADPSSPGSFQVLAEGTLTIAGSAQPIELTVDGVVEGDRLRIRGSSSMAMSDFNVKPPSAMLGLIKTGDPVTVEFDLTTRYGRVR